MKTEQKSKRGGWSGGPLPEPSGRLFLALAVLVPVLAVAGYSWLALAAC